MFNELPFATISMLALFSYSKRSLPGIFIVSTPPTRCPLRSVWTKSALSVEIARNALTAWFSFGSAAAATGAAGASMAAGTANAISPAMSGRRNQSAMRKCIVHASSFNYEALNSR